MPSFVSRLPASVRAFFVHLMKNAKSLWRKFRGLKLWLQVVIGLVLVALIGAAIALASSGGATSDADSGTPTVTVESVAELSGNGESVSVLGSVRSLTEAALLAESSGSVTAVHTQIGASVPAGFIIAELENASQRAAVLQAEGAYDAAVAARSATSLSGAETTARNSYQSAFTSLDTALTTEVDAFFGEPTPTGPRLLISAGNTALGELSRDRASIDERMDTWRAHLPSASTASPDTLLAEAQSNTEAISVFLTKLSGAANERDSNATASQLASLAAARATVDGVLASLASARDAYRSRSTGATAGADASVKTAQGGLQAAQANLEKTIVRAPIAGTVNFLPIRVGDYVTALTHVATVAQNGALEIVAFVSEDDRASLSVGKKIKVEGAFDGVVTSISPALDPVTKQIEVHVAVAGETNLVNGQSVRLALPTVVKATTATPTGPLMLPLSAVKLMSASRVVFSVGEDGRLVAHAVEIGDVRGDRLEIRTPLDPSLRIVSDARGLSEGQKVNVATQ